MSIYYRVPVYGHYSIGVYIRSHCKMPDCMFGEVAHLYECYPVPYCKHDNYNDGFPGSPGSPGIWPSLHLHCRQGSLMYTYSLHLTTSGYNVAEFETLCDAKAHAHTMWAEQALSVGLFIWCRETGELDTHVSSEDIASYTEG
jgi:hypothetical protein